MSQQIIRAYLSGGPFHGRFQSVYADAKACILTNGAVYEKTDKHDDRITTEHVVFKHRETRETK